MVTLRLSGLLCSLLIWNSSFAAARILDDLERSAQDLNVTDSEEVAVFIEQWSVPNRLKNAQFPPLASVLPVADVGNLFKRQTQYTCTWSNGNGCTGQGALCCGPIQDGWCCAASTQCCQGSSSGCCGGDGFCCGSQTGHDAGDCCQQGQQCCKGGTGKPFCCDSGQTCDNDNRKCANPTATVTITTTRWTTITDTETVTASGVTTVGSIAGSTTTVYVTYTGTALPSDLGTATGTLHAGKRYITDFPAPTGAPEGLKIREPRPFNIRPEPSLNALANVLSLRGVAIERRATTTFTMTTTVQAATTVTETTTSTAWSTKSVASAPLVTKTVAVLVNGDSTQTVVSGATGTSSASSGGSKKKSSNTGAIAGGVVGGIAGLAILALLLFFLFRRQKRLNNVQELPPNTQPGTHPPGESKPLYTGPGGYGVHEYGHTGAYGTPIPPSYSSPQQSAMYSGSHPSTSPPPGGLYEMPATHQNSPPQEIYSSNYQSSFSTNPTEAQPPSHPHTHT